MTTQREKKPSVVSLRRCLMYSPAMDENGITGVDKVTLINVIASKRYKAGEISKRFGLSVEYLRAFTEDNHQAIVEANERLQDEEETSEPSVETLNSLWISSKSERLKRYEAVADFLYEQIVEERDPDTPMSDAYFSTLLREYRSYLSTVANELGQLMHRGSGDAGTGDSLSIEMNGVNLESLR